jgi:hypothetical protein
MTTTEDSRPATLDGNGTAVATGPNSNWDHCPFCGALCVDHKVEHSRACAQQVSLDRLREDDELRLVASNERRLTRQVQQAEIVDIALRHDRQALGPVVVTRYGSDRYARRYTLARGDSILIMDRTEVVLRDHR